MSGTNTVQVGPKAPQAGWLYAAAAVLVIVVVVAGGYGILQSVNPGGGVGAPASLEPTATPVATPAVITGTENCSTTAAEATTIIVNGTTQERGATYACTTTMSDPRLTGGGSATMNTNEAPDGTWLAWGTRQITNDGGTWSGPYFIESTTTASSMTFDVVVLGEGDYAGLAFRGSVTMRPERTTWTGTVVQLGPKITGHSTCNATSGGTDTTVGDITASRGAVLVCNDEESDARVSGRVDVLIDMDVRADLSADMWGTQLSTNADGKWVGRYVGTVDPGYTTHHVEVLLRGTGAYDGLFLRQTSMGDMERGFDLVSWIIPAE